MFTGRLKVHMSKRAVQIIFNITVKICPYKDGNAVPVLQLLYEQIPRQERIVTSIHTGFK